MHNTFIASTITLRTTKGSLPFSFNDCNTYETRPFAYSSTTTTCYCSLCDNSLYRVPISPNYSYNLYGFRQSSLIQWSPCRKSCFGGFDRCYYSRVPVCNVDRRCYCDQVCNFREKSRNGKRGGLRKCMVFEERSESYDLEGMDEAEAVLSLLSEDIGNECLNVRRESNRLVKKPMVEKRENCGVSSKYGSKKKRVDIGVLESEARCEYESVVSSSRKRDNRRREERAQKEELREAILRKENQKDRIRDEKREALLRKASQKDKEKQEQESLLRKENWKARAREEEREEFSRTEEHGGQRVRKDGSSCSSYYSFSSTGDYENDHAIELKKGKFSGESSSGRKSNTQSNKIVCEDYIEDHGVSLTKKSTTEDSNVGSSVVESDFRKKSEKKLIEETESRKATVERKSELSSGYRKSSDSYMKYDEIKSTGNTNLDVEKKQLSKERSGEVSNQSETKMKYKQLEEISDTNTADFRTSYGSQKLYSVKDEYQRNSLKGAEVSDIVDVDIRNASISQKKFETSVKTKEDFSTNVSSSVYGAEKQRYYDEAQELTKKESTSILKKQSDSKFTKQEENINLAYGTSVRESRVTVVEEENKTNLETLVRPSSHLGAITDNVTYESSQSDSSSLRGRQLGRSTALHHETYGELDRGKAHEDAIESATRFQESSAHYVGEFIDSTRHEISSSEIQEETKTNKTNLVQKEKNNKKNMVQSSSKDSESKGCVVKGPSSEMWKVEEPFVQEQEQEQEQPKVVELQEDENKADNTIVKRNGRSLWNVISDVVRLRWTPRSASRSSSGKTGGKSSSNQSMSSEAWFSSHEAEENKETTIEKQESTSSIKGEEESARFISKGSSSSSNLEGHLAMNAPSSAVVLESSFPSTGETSNTGEKVESSISMPALRLRRSPVVRLGSKTEEENVSMEQSEEAVNEGEPKIRKLKRKDQIPKDRFDEWEEACKFEAEQRKNDEMFMREALLEAQKAADHWEVPVGAVLVHNGKIIARGWNLVEELRDSTAHAEMICIREASNVLRTWRLSETTLYVTLEPCPMCAGAILQARIDTVVWGAPNKLLGADGSWIRLFPNGGDGGNGLEQSEMPPAPVHPFHPKIIIRRGVLASECADAMQQFFQLRRKKKDKKPESPPAPPSCLPISRNHTKILAKMHGAFNFMFCL
ncbi:hypothetical protein ACJIZ3_020075 [Penstemon smallii]|uniref:tRNA(adenine(34)) deaminase n=1 Tax=Penstemon smallii TaxID=265156 RepID=A0ABD3SHK6_9LAMI